MLKEELGEFGGSRVISSRYEQRILGDSAYYRENTVVFLAVLHRRRQTCDPIKANLLEWRIPRVSWNREGL